MDKLALSVAKMYGLSEVQALEELKEIKNVVESNWRRLAGQYGLGRSEIEGMALAFDMSFKGKERKVPYVSFNQQARNRC